MPQGAVFRPLVQCWQSRTARRGGLAQCLCAARGGGAPAAGYGHETFHFQRRRACWGHAHQSTALSVPRAVCNSCGAGMALTDLARLQSKLRELWLLVDELLAQFLSSPWRSSVPHPHAVSHAKAGACAAAADAGAAGTAIARQQ